MPKLLQNMILALLLLALPIGSGAIEIQDSEFLFEPGMTYFDAADESFVVVTTQPICIRFGDIAQSHVFGTIEPLLGDPEEDLVKFLWLQPGADPISLFDGNLCGRMQVFDSEATTGHNEKNDD